MPGPRRAPGENYLAQAAHELRGSLNAILGWAEFLRRGPCDDAARIRAAETIIHHARQQSGMIAELMDTWRATAGTLRLNISRFDVASAVHAAIEAVRPLARARSIRIDLCGDPSGGVIRGDACRLAHALTTLLANAIHFAPEQSSIAVRLELGAGASRLTVHDPGPAVPPTSLPFLFDRDQPTGAAHHARGTYRLGLSLVRDVIARHGGSIEAESGPQPGGMVFRIVLPTEPPIGAVAPVTGLPAETGGNFAPARLGGLRVLLVDDEPDAREALTGILRHSGAVVHAAGSAAEAIGALQHQPFDVLLADIGMPGEDGYDLIRHVRRLGAAEVAHVPAVAVTAFASVADRRRAIEAGFQAHLSKPIDAEALVAAVAVVARPAGMVR